MSGTRAPERPVDPDPEPSSGDASRAFPAAGASPSLRRRLLVAIGVPLLAITLAGTWLDWRQARATTDDAYDQSLAATAEALSVRIESDVDSDIADHLDTAMALMARIDAPDRWRYLVLGTDNRVLAGDPTLRDEWRPGPPGTPRFHTRPAVRGASAERVVAYEHVGPEGRARIVVAETTDRRDMAVRALVGTTLLPNLAILALTLATLGFGVRIAVRPLDALGRRVAARAPDDFAALPLAGTPRETLPLLRSLNALLARVRAASRTQQAFLNQAAHQLRTPLAGLQAQIELWRERPDEDPGERLAQMHRTVLRLGHLTRRLLALARADASASADLATEPVSLVQLVTEAAAEIDDDARRRGVRVRFALDEAVVPGVPWMLRELLQNLADNAVAHAPAGSEVRVACGTEGSGAPWLEVEDGGPGIPADQRERVFEPFLRLADDTVPGTGLGLAIVRQIALRHGAQLFIRDGADGRGTVVRATFRQPSTDVQPPVTGAETSAI